MKNQRHPPGLMLWLALIALTAASAAQALQVTDDRGVTVTFAQTPQRIVSLLPSLTATVLPLFSLLH